MALLTPEAERLLLNAYTAGVDAIARDKDAADAIARDKGAAHVPAEPFDAITKIEQHRWHWRPEHPRLILIAESHVYTTDADINVMLNQSDIAAFIPSGQHLPPSHYVGLVYCLGYGEKKLLRNPHDRFSNRGTWPFWDMFGRIVGNGKQPRANAGTSLSERLRWKIETLTRLKEIGIWLLDSSAHAIYIGKKKRRSLECCQALHRQWWDHYGRRIVIDCGNPVVWVIGSSLYNQLTGLDGFNCKGFIYQPGARGDIDKERNWGLLLADVAMLRQNPIGVRGN